jgi:hypothetical protein
VNKNPALAQSAIASVRGGAPGGALVAGPLVLAPANDGTDTNGAAQNALNAIAVLELCADVLPANAPPGGGGGRGGRGGGRAGRGAVPAPAAAGVAAP